MMPLTELLLACSLHADQRLLEAIVDVYSAGNPSTVVDVGISALEGQDQPLAVLDGTRSSGSARADAFRMLAQGGDPLFGLLPVRPAWAREFGKSVDDLFEPCANVAVASAKISEFDYACRSHGPRPTSLRRRACTLRGYAGSVALPALPRARIFYLAPFRSLALEVEHTTALTRQVFHFTGLSWRSMLPVTEPVTIFYPHLIADKLTRLSSLPDWDDKLLDTRLRRSRWFL